MASSFHPNDPDDRQPVEAHQLYSLPNCQDSFPWVRCQAAGAPPPPLTLHCPAWLIGGPQVPPSARSGPITGGKKAVQSHTLPTHFSGRNRQARASLFNPGAWSLWRCAIMQQTKGRGQRQRGGWDGAALGHSGPRNAHLPSGPSFPVHRDQVKSSEGGGWVGVWGLSLPTSLRPPQVPFPGGCLRTAVHRAEEQGLRPPRAQDEYRVGDSVYPSLGAPQPRPSDP